MSNSWVQEAVCKTYRGVDGKLVEYALEISYRTGCQNGLAAKLSNSAFQVSLRNHLTFLSFLIWRV
jgi:hypothetical protein